MSGDHLSHIDAASWPGVAAVPAPPLIRLKARAAEAGFARACQAAGIAFDQSEAHSALYDAQVTAEAVEALTLGTAFATRREHELGRIAAADFVHVDVMDNHFVPNLTFGPTMVEALARSTEVPLDAHLMIADVDRHAPAYVEAGCGSVTFHVEAASAPVRLAREVRAAGARASRVPALR